MVTRIAARLGTAIVRRADLLPVLAMCAMLAICLVLPGCASLTTGTGQTIAVTTTPEVHASCTLRNASGSWRVARTPGTVTVQRAYGDLAVACAAVDGASGEATASSGVATAAYGNILLMGSVVWAAVDAASGAAFAYPDRIAVPLKTTIAAPAAPLEAAVAAAVAAADDPQLRLQQLHALRAEHRISAMEYQLRLADLAAASATAAPVVAAAPAADDPRSRLQQLQLLRSEHRISAVEYQLRRAELIERGGLPADTAAQR